MSLGPSGDLVMDVARAADPARARAAVSRLESAGATIPFASVMEQSALARLVHAQETSDGGLAFARTQHGVEGVVRGEGSGRNAGAFFETLMLQVLLQKVIPQSGATSFGEGVAGSSYKMLMAEHLAGQMVKGGGLGISAMIERSLMSRQDDIRQPAILGRLVDG